MSKGNAGASGISLDEADRIASGVIAWGRDNDSGRLTAAVLDAGGHLVVVKRDDGAEFLRADIAIGKAWGALGMGIPGRLLAEKAAAIPQFMTALSVMSGGRMVPVAGGVLIRRDGMVVGAVGVSGDTSSVDEHSAVAAVDSVGLQADTGQNDEWNRP
ncbi:MAG: heme-binding protein [Acidimicrobiia bacterium]